MDYQSYARTKAMGDARERAKVPGQDFCNEVGWKLMNKYKEIQRPDKITMLGGTIYRTITPTTHCWYRHKSTGENFWIEFGHNGRVEIKRGIRVRESPAIGFGQVFLNPEPDYFREITYFYSNKAAADYLVNL